VLSSGFPVLDEATGGGWPLGSLVELLSPASAGLSLLLPSLIRLSRRERWLAWVNPPWIPNAPALAARGMALAPLLWVKSGGAEGRWAVEQLLRSGGCPMVLYWPGRILPAQLRRLQLAAERGGASAVLFRPLEAAGESSTAALRLRLERVEKGLRVRVLKRRGGWHGAEVVVPCFG